VIKGLKSAYLDMEGGIEEKMGNVKVPGFEAIFALAGLLAVAYLLRKRR
jgi:PGF-CTERM protein